MRTLFLSVAAVALFAGPALAQTASPAASPAPAPAPLQIEIPELDRVTADPTCGGRAYLVQQATCVTTTQTNIGPAVDAYSAAFSQQGWLAAGGRENLVVYVKRRETGGCDGFQMMAFADDAQTEGPDAPAWLAFAPIPGDVCATTTPPTPAAPAAANP
ncbi:hypothetical protein [Brevundimonas sp. GCM10030266]|uniref:hypothetical protein n=1 Tax=Brevundimonas sp. GCM10030266 TaxID=3273386 RepID=UPI00361F7D66